MNKFKIYLDCCCFCRPFDDLSQQKVNFEREAVLSIINSCEEGLWDVFRSDALEDEISRITDTVKQQKVLKLYSSAKLNVEINDEIIDRSSKLIKMFNLGAFDAVHLASAEYGKADILLTTDRKFYNRVIKSNTKIKIANPALWITEVLLNE
jgi:predicted nucleic acid-binding protein